VTTTSAEPAIALVVLSMRWTGFTRDARHFRPPSSRLRRTSRRSLNAFRVVEIAPSWKPFSFRVATGRRQPGREVPLSTAT